MAAGIRKRPYDPRREFRKEERFFVRSDGRFTVPHMIRSVLPLAWMFGTDRKVASDQ